MRRLCLAGILLLAGCQNVAGPFSMRKPERVDDPLLSIPEQKARGRERLALPDDSVNVAPRTGVAPPDGPYGLPR
jgi:hypothetical protein